MQVITTKACCLVVQKSICLFIIDFSELWGVLSMSGFSGIPCMTVYGMVLTKTKGTRFIYEYQAEYISLQNLDRSQ